MAIELIKNKILQYLDFIQDADYLASIINSTSASELCKIIEILLHSEDDKTVGLACLFIRDLVLFGVRHPDCAEFVTGYSKSSIVTALDRLIFSPNHFIRKHSIYTLGKTCSYGSLNALNQAFSQFRDTDPILLTRLLAEMKWLRAENIWELLDSTIDSPIDLTRWSVLATLSEFIGEDLQVQNQIDRLRNDTNCFVRAEAEYEHQLHKFRSANYNGSRGTYKQKRKVLEQQYKPALRFDRLSLVFTNHLCECERTQYSIAELEAFLVDFLQVIA